MFSWEIIRRVNANYRAIEKFHLESLIVSLINFFFFEYLCVYVCVAYIHARVLYICSPVWFSCWFIFFSFFDSQFSICIWLFSRKLSSTTHLELERLESTTIFIYFFFREVSLSTTINVHILRSIDRSFFSTKNPKGEEEWKDKFFNSHSILRQSFSTRP